MKVFLTQCIYMCTYIYECYLLTVVPLAVMFLALARAKSPETARNTNLHSCASSTLNAIQIKMKKLCKWWVSGGRCTSTDANCKRRESGKDSYLRQWYLRKEWRWPCQLTVAMQINEACQRESYVCDSRKWPPNLLLQWPLRCPHAGCYNHSCLLCHFLLFLVFFLCM